ncbi:MAG: hypothetical protein Q7R48_03920 [bacterium]|nr:hypothetical protein [bacterium]
MQSRTEQLKPIVRELLTQDPDALNGTMAEEASRRLGRQIDRKEISRIRNLIGLGMFHQIAAEQDRRIRRMLGLT